ncbi:HNH endonuclease [Yinghuangia aomiensis]
MLLCGHRGSPENPLTVDHIKPLSLGGASADPANLRTLCRLVQFGTREQNVIT